MILYILPPNGRDFDGQELTPGAFRVARIRWLWDLQRPRFRQAASLPGPVPEIAGNQAGRRLSAELRPNEAADVDLVVSYNKPYWPAGEQSIRDNSRLGPLRNGAGMWLTATSYRRSQTTYPAPEGLIPRLPKPGEEPNRIMGGAPGRDKNGEMYWFVESNYLTPDRRSEPVEEILGIVMVPSDIACQILVRSIAPGRNEEQREIAFAVVTDRSSVDLVESAGRYGSRS